MEIDFKKINDTLYISFCGELDDCSASFARNLIDEKLRALSYKDVVFDMANLSFMDSTGIGVLIGRYKYLKNNQIKAYISNPTSVVEKIFRMSGIFEIMPKISWF